VAPILLQEIGEVVLCFFFFCYSACCEIG
jgi:hypothetical protein